MGGRTASRSTAESAGSLATTVVLPVQGPPVVEAVPAGGQLSGGQRQRVAMRRAIVREPGAFLMDEPLSNLDARLRVQMRTEIARIQHELGVTTVYVTHDQVEAMTMADRVAVLRGGVLQQLDTPQRVYAEPANLFVATFIGSPVQLLRETEDRGRALDPRPALGLRDAPDAQAEADVVVDAVKPQLTTVALPHYELGRVAISVLLDEDHAQQPKGRTLIHRIPMPLRERESVRHLTRPRSRRRAAALA